MFKSTCDEYRIGQHGFIDYYVPAESSTGHCWSREFQIQPDKMVKGLTHLRV